MEESFDLPVRYGGLERDFSSRLIVQGYTHKFVIMVEETEVVYERDEEGCYRALLAHPEAAKGKLPEPGLLQVIGEKLGTIVS